MTDPGAQVTPGWYHATGDPPGTQRYWDGSQWLGGPQTIGVVTPGASGVPGLGPAEHGARFLAALIDNVGMFALGLLLGFPIQFIATAISDLLGTLLSWMWWVVVLGGWIYNWAYLQGTTGQTIGKRITGVKLVSAETGQPIGVGMALVRVAIRTLLHFLTCGVAGLIGAIIILADSDRQRLTDKTLKWRVVQA